MDVRHDLGVIPAPIRVELERRITLATDGDQDTTVVLLMNRHMFEEMFAQQGVRVMVSELVPSGSAFVVDLAGIRARVEHALRPVRVECDDTCTTDCGRCKGGLRPLRAVQ